jgi:hypothetical protein
MNPTSFNNDPSTLRPVRLYRLILRDGAPVLQQCFEHPQVRMLGLVAEFRDVPGAIIPPNDDLQFWEAL